MRKPHNIRRTVDIATMKQWRNQGMTYDEIGKKAVAPGDKPLTKQAIAQTLRYESTGSSVGRPSKNLLQGHLSEIMSLRKKGMSWDKISRELNLPFNGWRLLNLMVIELGRPAIDELHVNRRGRARLNCDHENKAKRALSLYKEGRTWKEVAEFFDGYSSGVSMRAMVVRWFGKRALKISLDTENQPR